MALGLAVAHTAAAQDVPSTSLKAQLGRPRAFNPFLPFSFSRLTVNPLGLPKIAGLAADANAPGTAPVVIPVAPTSAPIQAASLTSDGGSEEASLSGRPQYRPPVRSPYRPPPRPPF